MSFFESSLRRCAESLTSSPKQHDLILNEQPYQHKSLVYGNAVDIGLQCCSERRRALRCILQLLGRAAVRLNQINDAAFQTVTVDFFEVITFCRFGSANIVPE